LKSDPLPGSPLVYRKNLPEDTKRKIREAILNAHKEMAKVTGYGELSQYVAATPAEYQKIRDLVSELGLVREQMLK
jgi:phosphonate transport system substrate-binding protein